MAQKPDTLFLHRTRRTTEPATGSSGRTMGSRQRVGNTFRKPRMPPPRQASRGSLDEGIAFRRETFTQMSEQ